MVSIRRLWWVAGLVGAVIGMLVARAIFFEPIEELAWRLFWERPTSLFSADDVMTSSTFLKSVVGAAVGGLALAGLTLVVGSGSTDSDR